MTNGRTPLAILSSVKVAIVPLDKPLVKSQASKQIEALERLASTDGTYYWIAGLRHCNFGLNFRRITVSSKFGIEENTMLNSTCVAICLIQSI